MTWFKVDDTFAFHPKAVAAGNAALGLWVRAGAWCSQQLTDGVVPDHMIGALGNASQARRLVEVGLWERLDGGYRFWQWGERQPTREQVELDRTAARERMRRIRTGPRSSGEHTGEGSRDVRANTRRTSGGVRDPRPDPSRPEGTGGVDVGESSSARTTATPDDDDRDSKINERIVDVIAETTGRAVTAEHASKIRRQILDGRTVNDPAAYVAAAIRGNPRDYLPSAGDPPSTPVRQVLREVQPDADAGPPAEDPPDTWHDERERMRQGRRQA